MICYEHFHTAAPVITAMSSSSLSAVDIVLGSNITLTCTSSGSPPDTFIWIKDYFLLLPQSNDITTVTYTNTMAVFSSSYTISNIGIIDNGIYTCIVINPIGSDYYSFTVNIRKLLYVYMYICIRAEMNSMNGTEQPEYF